MMITDFPKELIQVEAYRVNKALPVRNIEGDVVGYRKIEHVWMATNSAILYVYENEVDFMSWTKFTELPDWNDEKTFHPV